MFKKSIKTLIVVIAVMAFAGFSYAYAAANTVPPTKAGDGAGVITGYDVSAVNYTLNTTNPSNIDSVAFTLDAPATSVRIRLVSTGSTWFSCTGTTNIVCTTTGATVLAADSLQVVAVGN